MSASLASSTLLTAPGAEREVRHVVLELGDSSLVYEPGDSLGIWPHNNPDEVELLIAILRAKGSEAVTLPDGAVVSAREALGRECNLRMPSDSLYALLASEAKDEADRFRLSKLADPLSGVDVLAGEAFEVVALFIDRTRTRLTQIEAPARRPALMTQRRKGDEAMQRLNIFTVWLIGISLFTPGPTWASWAQVDHATSDATLKHLTDEGSNAFLEGAIESSDMNPANRCRNSQTGHAMTDVVQDSKAK